MSLSTVKSGESTTTRYGVPAGSFSKLVKVAQSNNCTIIIRTTNPGVILGVENKYVAGKPLMSKPKSCNAAFLEARLPICPYLAKNFPLKLPDDKSKHVAAEKEFVERAIKAQKSLFEDDFSNGVFKPINAYTSLNIDPAKLKQAQFEHTLVTGIKNESDAVKVNFHIKSDGGKILLVSAETIKKKSTAHSEEETEEKTKEKTKENSKKLEIHYLLMELPKSDYSKCEEKLPLSLKPAVNEKVFQVYIRFEKDAYNASFDKQSAISFEKCNYYPVKVIGERCTWKKSSDKDFGKYFPIVADYDLFAVAVKDRAQIKKQSKDYFIPTYSPISKKEWDNWLDGDYDNSLRQIVKDTELHKHLGILSSFENKVRREVNAALGLPMARHGCEVNNVIYTSSTGDVEQLVEVAFDSKANEAGGFPRSSLKLAYANNRYLTSNPAWYLADKSYCSDEDCSKDAADIHVKCWQRRLRAQLLPTAKESELELNHINNFMPMKVSEVAETAAFLQNYYKGLMVGLKQLRKEDTDAGHQRRLDRESKLLSKIVYVLEHHEAIPLKCKIKKKDGGYYEDFNAVKIDLSNFLNMAEYDSPETDQIIRRIIEDGQILSIQELAKKTLMQIGKLRASAKKLQRLFRSHRAVKGSINMDQLKGKSFTELRRERLKKLQENFYLYELYGFRTSKDLRLYESQLGLRISHDKSTLYLRHNNELALKVFQDLSKEKTKTARKETNFFSPPNVIMPPRYGYFFVNTKFVKNKIESLNQDLGNKLDLDFYPLAQGIYFMRARLTQNSLSPEYIPNPGGWSAADGRKRGVGLYNALIHLGANPSVYQALKEIKAQRIALNSGIDNTGLLNKLIKNATFNIISNSNSLRFLQGSVFFLINGLQSKLISQTDRFKQDPVIRSALESLNNIVDSLKAKQNNMLNSARLYELVMDELFMILARVAPYKHTDFATAVIRNYKSRIPELEKGNLKNINPTVCIDSSGMGALSTALAAALNDYGKGCRIEFIGDQNYFEFPTFVKLFCSENIDSKNNKPPKIFLATLNPSSPTGTYDLQHVKIAMEKKLKTAGLDKNKADSVTLILDITVEIDEGDQGQLNNILKGFSAEILSGQLNIIFAKSLQKYPSLGAAKIMSGVAIAINSGHENFKKSTDFLNKAIKESNFIVFDENQLMTHFMENAAEYELKMIQNGITNAAFVSKNCWQKSQYDNVHVPHLPFLKKKPGVFCGDFKLEKIEIIKDLVVDILNYVLERSGVEGRDSFSFLNSSYLQYLGSYRITIGQESNDRLREKFYAIGLLVTGIDELNYSKINDSIKENKNAGRVLLEAVAEKYKAKTTQNAINTLKSENGFVKYGKIASLLSLKLLILEKMDEVDRAIKAKEINSEGFEGIMKAVKSEKSSESIDRYSEDFKSLKTQYDDFFDYVEKQTKATQSTTSLLEKLTPEMQSDLVLSWLKLTLKVDAEKFNIKSFQEYVKYVPSYRLALFFIETYQEIIFEKQTPLDQAISVQYLLGRLDADTLVTVYEKVAEDGGKVKCQQIGKHLAKLLSIYVLTDDVIKDLKRQQVVKQSADLSSLKHKVFTTEGELFHALEEKINKHTEPSETFDLEAAKQKLFKLTLRDKEASFYITNGDLASIDENYNTDLQNVLKAEVNILFTSVDKLKKRLEKLITKTLYPKKHAFLIVKLIGMSVHRSKRILMNEGLLGRNITQSVYFAKASAIQEIKKDIRDLNKKKFSDRFRTRTQHARISNKKNKDLMELIKQYQAEKHNAVYVGN